MHRVELKDSNTVFVGTGLLLVPNAPCGVESLIFHPPVDGEVGVPNAPCGVERW